MAPNIESHGKLFYFMLLTSSRLQGHLKIRANCRCVKESGCLPCLSDEQVPCSQRPVFENFPCGLPRKRVKDLVSQHTATDASTIWKP